MTLGPDLLLSPLTHDLDISSGDLQMRINIAQAIKIRLLFVRGEWYLDIEAGIPFFEQIWIKNPNLDHLRTLYRTTIIETPGVKNLLAFTLDFNAQTRRMAITFRADTDEGELSSEVNL